MIIVDNRFASRSVECVAYFQRYNNGQLALQLFTKDSGESWATASAACLGEDIPPDCMFVKDYSINEGMVSLLTNAGVIEGPPVKTARSGFVLINAYKLTETALKEANV